MNFLGNLFRKNAATGGGIELTANDAILSLLREPPTAARYVPAKIPNGEEITCFTIREDSQHIASLPKQVSIEVRCGLIKESNVGLFAVMLRIESEIYETWWNWCNPLGERCLRNIAKQDKLVIAFFVNSTSPARTLWTPNTLRETFEAVMVELSGMKRWEMAAFDNARERVYGRYSSPQALWASM